MSVVASIFLRAKHWQMFLLLFVVPTAAEITAGGFIPATIRSWNDLGRPGVLLICVTVLYMFCVVAWFWSMGSLFGSIVKPALKLKEGVFLFALVYPLIYSLFVVWLFLAVPVGVIVPLHLLCMFCLFYILYFVAKSLVLAETGEPVSFYDYAGPFFLLWFYPLGVWIIQPRVNRLYAGRSGTDSWGRARTAQ